MLVAPCNSINGTFSCKKLLPYNHSHGDHYVSERKRGRIRREKGVYLAGDEANEGSQNVVLGVLVDHRARGVQEGRRGDEHSR